MNCYNCNKALPLLKAELGTKYVCLDCFPAHKIAPIAGKVVLIWSIVDVVKAKRALA